MSNTRLQKKADEYHARFANELGHEWQRLSDFKGSHEKLTAIHIPCGEIRTAPARDFFRRGCRTCERVKAYKTRFGKRGSQYIQQIEQQYNVVSASEYRGAREPHVWRCNVCGAEIVRTVENILFRGGGYGGGIRCDCQKPINYDPLIRVLRRRLREIERQEEVKNLCSHYSQIGYEIVRVDENMRNITLKHTECGRVWISDVWRMRKGHGCVACSRCGTSHGVQQIEKYLQDNHIVFEREATFPTCKRERMLPFDFAVYDDQGNLDYLIEFQGEQHYRASPLFGGKEKLRRVQEADAIKRRWARENGINLVIIDWNEDIYGRMSTTGK